jgi:hypothetical protein
MPLQYAAMPIILTATNSDGPFRAREAIRYFHSTSRCESRAKFNEPRSDQPQLRNVGLMNAILALSTRHLSLSGEVRVQLPNISPSDAIGYYYKALHYSQKAMEYDTYKTSLELLASSLIISSYEMLDGSNTNWEKHLKGVFWIQRSQVIHGDSGGLRQAVWWAWLCQDVWAAFREKRKPFTFWQPTRGFHELSPSEIAARSVLNFAKVIGFCAQDDVNLGKDTATRANEADALLQLLEHWNSYLTWEFNPLPMGSTLESSSEPFRPLWVRPAPFGQSATSPSDSLLINSRGRHAGLLLLAYLSAPSQTSSRGGT